MASSQTKKPEAKVDAKKPSVPAIVDPKVDPLFKLPDWKAEADAAFKEYADGAKKVNNSEQHLAYAIMAYCASLVVSGVTGNKLSDIMPARNSKGMINTAAMNYLRKKCIEEFKVVFVNKKTLKDLTFEKIEETHNKAEERSPGMFSRAFSLAYLFARDGVTYAQFDRTLGVFKVKPRLMVEGDAIDDKIAYYGRMAKADLLPIDGLSIYYVTSDKLDNPTPHDVNASLAHYKMCNKPEGQSRGTGGTQTQTTPAAPMTKAEGDAATKKVVTSAMARYSVDDAADLISTERLAQLLEYRFCQLAEGPVTYRKQETTKTWNFIDNIVARAIRSRKEPNWETGPEVITGPTTKGTKKVA